MFSGRINHTAYLLFLILFSPSINSFSQPDTSKSNLSFDLGITRDRNLNLWPFIKIVKNQKREELQILFPLFSKSINYDKHYKHAHCLPFVILDSSSKANDKRILSCYYPSALHFKKQFLSNSTIRSSKFIELAPSVSLYGISRSSSGMLMESNLLFLFSYKKDTTGTDTRYTAFPVYWYFANKQDTTSLLLPLYYKKSSLFENHLNVALFFNYKKTADEKNIVLFPIVYSYKSSSSKSLTIFPLFSKGSSADFTRNHFTTLLFWHQKNPECKKDILFPIYWRSVNYSKDDIFVKNTLFPFFSYGRSKINNSSHYSILFLYWHLKDNNSRKNVLIPIWWSSNQYSKNDTFKNRTLFPVYWSRKSNAKDNKIVFPVIYSLKDSKYQSFTAFPLISAGHSTDFSTKHFYVFPLYWHDQSKDTLWNVLFPVYWSQKNNTGKNVILFPFVYSFKNQYSNSFLLFPLFSYGKKNSLDSSYFSILPLYWHFNTQNSKKDILFPLWWGSKHCYPYDTITKRTLFPLYWSIKSNVKDNNILFPVIFSIKSTNYHSFTFSPLFSYGHAIDKSDQYLDVLVLFWHRKNKDYTRNVLFPLWWNSSHYTQNDTIIRRTLFPVFWSTKSKEKENNVVFPLFYGLKNNQYQSLTFLPFFSFGHSSDFKSRHLDVLLVYWHKESKNNSRNILFPVYWSVKTKEKNNTTIFPLVYKLKNDSRQSFTVLPIYFSNTSTILNSHYKVVFPLYWHTDDLFSKTDVLFPVWWSSQYYSKYDTLIKRTLFPVYWSVKGKHKKNDFLFPLIYRTRNQISRSISILPLFSYGKTVDRKNNYLAIAPLYWHIKEADVTRDILFPIYWRSVNYTQKDTITKNTLFPIYWSAKGSHTNNSVLLPFIYSLENRNYKSLTFFPLFSTGHSLKNDGKHLIITPLLWIYRSSYKKQVLLFPVFNYKKYSNETKYWFMYVVFRQTTRKNYSETSVLWPIFKYTKTNKQTSFRFAPLIWSVKTDTSDMFTFQPFYYSYKSKSKKTSVYLEILYKSEVNVGNCVSKNILWKLYNSKKYSNGDYESRFLYFIYVNIKKQGKLEKRFLPFYHKVIHPDGNQSVSVFFSFYNYFKRYKPELKQFYEEDRIFWIIRLRSNYNKLQPERIEKDLK